MKKILQILLFPIPYPAAFFWHIILGGFIAALIGIAAVGWDGHGYVWMPVLGAVICLVAGWLVVRK